MTVFKIIAWMLREQNFFKRRTFSLTQPIDNCAKDGVEKLFTRILCGIEEISQLNRSNLNARQSIMMKNSCPPSLAQSSITRRYHRENENVLLPRGCINHYYLTEVSKTRQCRIPPFLLANRTFPAGFP